MQGSVTPSAHVIIVITAIEKTVSTNRNRGRLSDGDAHCGKEKKMPRYIDADLLMKELGITDPDCVKCEWGSKLFPYCTRDGDFVDACDAICDAPTADVVERKKGKWRLNKEGNWACPFCEFDPYHDNMKGMNYCPNCGAELRGEEDG